MARQQAVALLLSALFLVMMSAGPRFCQAADEDPLQDFCVAQITGSPIGSINGFPCKPTAAVAASDFKFSGLNAPGNTANKLGAAVTPASVAQFPGLNTFGIGMARVDYAVGGLNPPHTHPRATELLFVVEGTLQVGFVSSNGNTLYQQNLNKGDVFVFPKGLLHFQKNVGRSPAWAIAALNSQTAGAQQAAAALFRSPLPSDVLQQTFGIDAKTVDKLKANQQQ